MLSKPMHLLLMLRRLLMLRMLRWIVLRMLLVLSTVRLLQRYLGLLWPYLRQNTQTALKTCPTLAFYPTYARGFHISKRIFHYCDSFSLRDCWHIRILDGDNLGVVVPFKFCGSGSLPIHHARRNTNGFL